MPLNRDFVGRSLTWNEPFEVTRNDIRRFASAIGDRNPAYHDVDAAKALGHTDLVAPPTFLITASSAGNDAGGGFFQDPDLGLRFEMVVHGEQRFELHRPVVAGDLLEGTVTITEIKDAGRNELITLTTEVTCRGERVATTHNTVVSRGTAAPKEA